MRLFIKGTEPTQSYWGVQLSIWKWVPSLVALSEILNMRGGLEAKCHKTKCVCPSSWALYFMFRGQIFEHILYRIVQRCVSLNSGVKCYALEESDLYPPISSVSIQLISYSCTYTRIVLPLAALNYVSLDGAESLFSFLFTHLYLCHSVLYRKWQNAKYNM